jgi:quercetin dioxygenase-like cupin family protein
MAKRLITGVDENGRSCVVEEASFDDKPLSEGARVQTVYRTSTTLSPRPAGRGRDTDMDVAAGSARWIRTELSPGEYLNHHTDTVDFDTVVSGYVDLILDDGDHRLNPEDCVVVMGVDHGWRAGPEGVVMSVVLIGSPGRE